MRMLKAFDSECCEDNPDKRCFIADGGPKVHSEIALQCEQIDCNYSSTTSKLLISVHVVTESG